ncbi:unnamed protein product [Closterium sp. NIES-54]
MHLDTCSRTAHRLLVSESQAARASAQALPLPPCHAAPHAWRGAIWSGVTSDSAAAGMPEAAASGVKCFGCNASGHVLKDCPQIAGESAGDATNLVMIRMIRLCGLLWV